MITKFLVVEDEFVSRKKMQKILEELCKESKIDMVANGEEAVQAFKLSFKEGKPYHVIMMDIIMPDMDGQEAVKRIRSIEKDFQNSINPNYEEAKVIMVSALKDSKHVLSSFTECGADNYIVKPFTKEKVAETLKKLNIIE